MMRRTVRVLTVGAVGVALALTAAAPAAAHSVLIGSTPATGETIGELPAQFSVTMNERLLADAGTSAFAMRVRAADSGLYYGDGCLEVNEATMTTAAQIGPAGDYVLEWQVVSADGHPVGGEIPFTWTGEATTEGSPTAPACGAEPAPSEPDDAGGHGGGPSELALGDVAWIVGAVLVVGIAVTVALVVTRRRR